MASQLPDVVIKEVAVYRQTPMAFEKLNLADIQRNNHGQDIPLVLENTVSAVATSDAGNGIGYTGIRIRGVDASRINVTLNGIPYNDAESQAVFWVNLRTSLRQRNRFKFNEESVLPPLEEELLEEVL